MTPFEAADRPTRAPPRRDEFGWTVLTALIDAFTWRVEGPVQVEILKEYAAGR